MRNPKLALLAAALLTACDLEEPTRPDAAPVAEAPADPADRTPSSIALQKIATIQGGGVGAAEITAFDPVSKRLFIVNGALGTVDVADLRDPSAPVMIGSLATAGLGGPVNSVAAHRGVIAVAVEGFTKTYGVKILVWHEPYPTAMEAIVGEKRLKRWRRAWKVALIEKHNPQWLDQYETLHR